MWALPGLILSGWAVLIGVAGFASGMPFSLAAEILGFAALVSALWLPVILYLAGTRLTLDDARLELRQLFGLRTITLPREQIARVERSTSEETGAGEALTDDADFPTIPVSYYDVIATNGRRWARLRSWVWNRSDCERLRDALTDGRARAAAVAAEVPVQWFVSASPPAAIQATRDTPSYKEDGADDRFLGALRSAGCVVQGASMLFGFAIAAVVLAAAFQLPLGRDLGEAAVPGLIIGAAIGSSAYLARQLYTFLALDARIGNAAAKWFAAVSVVVIPAVLWLVGIFVLLAVLNVAARGGG